MSAALKGPSATKIALRRAMCEALAGVLLGILNVLSPPAGAQQTNATNTPQDLAKAVHNPFEDFVKVPFQSTTAFDVGPHHNTGESLNVLPTLPFSVSRRLDLIIRPSLTATYLPRPHEQYGLEDLQTAAYLTPEWTTTWIFGVGPIFQFPTATSKELGTGRWSAGPIAALIYSDGPWFNGALAYQLMSFAGDRGHGSVNQTYIEPEISYNFDNGWFVDSDPPITYDWTAEKADAWIIPMGADTGKAFKLGSQYASLQIGSYYLVKSPDDSPRWIIRVQFTLLFPPGTDLLHSSSFDRARAHNSNPMEKAVKRSASDTHPGIILNRNRHALYWRCVAEIRVRYAVGRPNRPSNKPL